MAQSLTSEAKLQNLIDKLSSTDLLSPSNPDNELLVEPKANIRIFSPSTSSQSSSVVVTPLNQEDTNSKEQEDQQDGLSLSQRKKNHLRIQTTILDQDLNKQQQSSPISASSTDVASDSESELNPDFPALPPPPTSLTPGKHYALYPFKSTDPSHCSMNQDDEVELLNDQDSYWWLVRNQGSASASSGEKKTTDSQDDFSSYAGKIGFVPVDCLEDYCERLARLNCWKNEESEKALTKERFSSWGEEPQQELEDQQDQRLVRVKFDEKVLSYDCEDTYRYDSSDEEYGQGQDQFDDSDEEFERRLLHGFNRNYDDEDGESDEEEQGDIRRTEIEDDEQDIVHSDSSSSMSDTQYEDLLTTTTAASEDNSNSNSNVQRPIETNSDIASESFVAPLTLTKPMKRQQRRKPPTLMADGIIDQSTPEPIQHPYFQDINTGIAVDDFAPLQPGSFILNHNNDSNVGSIGTYSPSTASEYTPPMPQDQQQRFSDSASGEESKANKKNKKKEEDGQRNRSVWLLEELIKDELRDAKKDLGAGKVQDQGQVQDQSKELEEELNNSTIIDTEENDIGDTTLNSITPPTTTTTTKNENVDDSFEGDDLIAHLSKLPLVSSGELQRPKLLTELTPPLSQSSLLIATETDTATAATDNNIGVTISSPTSASTTSSSSRPNSDIIMSSSSLSKYNDNPSNSNSSDTTIATHTISGSVSNNELHPDIKTMFQESMMRFDKLEIMLREAQERLG